MADSRLKPHGRPAMPVGMHGVIRLVELPSAGKCAARYEAVCVVREVDGTTAKVSRRGASKTEARRRLHEALQNRTASRRRSSLRPTSRYAEAVALYQAQLDADVETGKTAPTTRDTYQRLMTLYVLPRLGQFRLQEVDVAVLEDMHDDVPVGASCRRQIRTVLRSSLQIALRRRAIADRSLRGRLDSPPRLLTLT